MCIRDRSYTAFKRAPPDAVVIDLTRMPSHGRAVAAHIRVTKYTRHLPIIFVDGDPEKVEAIRKRLPDATYTTRAKAGAAVKKVKPISDPVVPNIGMQSYGDRTVAQKLGIRENTRVALIDPPSGYARLLGALPAGASLEEEPEEPLAITLWFVRDPDTYQSGLPHMRQFAAKTRLWVVYPKKSVQMTDLTQFIVRESALAVGLVDYKVCSVSDTWTGMLFARKKPSR